MRIIGTGIDIIECARIEAMIAEHGDGFLQRVYTEREVDYCRHKSREPEHFAARWAAKEAVLKALGTGWAKGISFADVEVTREPSGLPQVVLRGGAADRARQMGIHTIHLSMSHCRDYATAQAVASGD